ncbi:MAG: hypothetical protein GMKNLPBB_00041 [Myxococcota bacterium]|nr:hypothetical protein [Myxococcota bacterium]
MSRSARLFAGVISALVLAPIPSMAESPDRAVAEIHQSGIIRMGSRGWEPVNTAGPAAIIFDARGAGGEILFGRVSASGYTLEIAREGFPPQMLHPGPVSWASFSPDGRGIALLESNGALLLGSIPEFPEFSMGWKAMRQGIRNFRWSPAGDRLAVVSENRLGVLDVRGGDLRWLADNHDTTWRAIMYAPAFDTHGQAIAYLAASREPDRAALAVVSLFRPGKAAILLETVPEPATALWWSADGDRLSYAAERYENTPVIVNITGVRRGNPGMDITPVEYGLHRLEANPSLLESVWMSFSPAPPSLRPVQGRPVNYNVKYADPTRGKGRITSHFSHGDKRYDCACNGSPGDCRPNHRGTDIGAVVNTPLYASATGVADMVKTGCGQRITSRCESTSFDCGQGFGNFVRMGHDGGMRSYYAHQTTPQAGQGQQLNCGQQLGTVGSTGHSYGCHVHFEIRSGNTAVDPFHGACNKGTTQSLLVQPNRLVSECGGGGPPPDPCEGKYGNGVCDKGCPKTDPDCDPCEGKYGDGSCDKGCKQQDPDCDPCEGKYDNGVCDKGCKQVDPDCDPCEDKYNDGVCDRGCDKPDPDCDPCEGKYGNGVCDNGCRKPDPDCDPCAGRYHDGTCDKGCNQPDPDCDLCWGKYSDGICDTECLAPDPDCGSDDPCKDKYMNGVCDLGCLLADPDCLLEDACTGKYGDGQCDQNCMFSDPDCPLDDPCARKYNDGDCDRGCATPDPDCGGAPPDPCEGKYSDGECHQNCSRPDPDCDPCEGKYGDGQCDQGCRNADPDCPSTRPDAGSRADSGASADGERACAADDFCDESCGGADPDCEAPPDAGSACATLRRDGICTPSCRDKDPDCQAGAAVSADNAPAGEAAGCGCSAAPRSGETGVSAWLALLLIAGWSAARRRLSAG